MTERDIRPAEIEREHLAEVHPARMWAYLLGVPIIGFLVMLGFMAILDALG
jgi:hypothetical protein